MNLRSPNIIIKLIVILTIAFLSILKIQATPQMPEGKVIDSLDQNYLNWYNLNPEIDKIQGASVDFAYTDILQNKEAIKQVIVAVIDGGVDIDHEDLQGKIWVNENEIPGNGIDDDDNGYIDDIHGWNFIGNNKGENIKYENIEEVRIFRKYDTIYKNATSINEVPLAQREEYKTYLACKMEYESELLKYQKRKKNTDAFENRLNKSEEIIKNYTKRDYINYSDLKNIRIADERILKARDFLMFVDEKGITRKSIEKTKNNNSKYLDKYLNLDFEPRNIISDNTEDINDNNYGNNDVKWMRSDHGTFVAGIIAANRNNDIGIDGVAENVLIMALRVVPIGDERDKDVALSIRYAVDNGANIINLSFGKNYSPQKGFVDEAIIYAKENNVLIIHAAGNKAEDIDEFVRYPSNILEDGFRAENWITVGATSSKLDKKFCGIFTNYGKESVDLFAPGVDVISLYPDNKYQMAGGTSFACPVVTGVAALVWSYYPELTAIELKNIIVNSTLNYPKLKVYKPNITTKKRRKTKFYKLSKTGGIINAVQALEHAETLRNEKQIEDNT